MPEDRLTHPRVGRSQKVGQLDDFSYRVWEQYRVSCDDYGVMPESAALLRGANVRLERATDAEVQAALDQMVHVELVHRFQHQGVSYIYSRTWQDHQKVKYPRGTHHPCPPREEILECTDDTRWLFTKHPQVDSKTFSDHLENGSRASKIKTPNGHANANTSTSSKGGSGGKDRFDRFWSAYPRKVGRGKAEDAWRKLSPDEKLLGRMLGTLDWQRHSKDWTKDDGQYIPHPTTWLNQQRWDDEPPAGEVLGGSLAPRGQDRFAATQAILARIRSRDPNEAERSGGEAA